jgi:hypothetical protein
MLQMIFVPVGVSLNADASRMPNSPCYRDISSSRNNRLRRAGRLPLNLASLISFQRYIAIQYVFFTLSYYDSTRTERKAMSLSIFSRLADSLKKTIRSLIRRRIMSREEIFHAGNIGDEPSANYQRSLNMLDNVLREGITLSRQYAEVIPTKSMAK